MRLFLLILVSLFYNYAFSQQVISLNGNVMFPQTERYNIKRESIVPHLGIEFNQYEAITVTTVGLSVYREQGTPGWFAYVKGGIDVISIFDPSLPCKFILFPTTLYYRSIVPRNYVSMYAVASVVFNYHFKNNITLEFGGEYDYIRGNVPEYQWIEGHHDVLYFKISKILYTNEEKHSFNIGISK